MHGYKRVQNVAFIKMLKTVLCLRMDFLCSSLLYVNIIEGQIILKTRQSKNPGLRMNTNFHLITFSKPSCG